MRAFLDTNIFISYLLRSNDESAITRCVIEAILGNYTLLIAQPLLDEIRRTITTKRYLARKITPTDLEDLMSILVSNAEMVPAITETIPAVGRDPKDDYLIAYGFLGQADYLVTGDEDLLVIRNVDTLQIVTPRQFVALLAG